MEDANLGMHGFVDLILETATEVLPVEFKLQDAPPTRAICLQLIAYGLLAEKTFQLPFNRGLVICGPHSRTYPVARTPELEQELAETWENLRRDRELPVLPPSAAQANKCTQCEYLPRCNDRF